MTATQEMLWGMGIYAAACTVIIVFLCVVIRRMRNDHMHLRNAYNVLYQQTMTNLREHIRAVGETEH